VVVEFDRLNLEDGDLYDDDDDDDPDMMSLDNSMIGGVELHSDRSQQQRKLHTDSRPGAVDTAGLKTTNHGRK